MDNEITITIDIEYYITDGLDCDKPLKGTEAVTIKDVEIRTGYDAHDWNALSQEEREEVIENAIWEDTRYNFTIKE